MLSQATEDYIKIIYKMQNNGAVSTKAIAEALNVTSASVTNMLKRLADMKLLQYTSYKGVKLTKSGEKIALEVIRHHRLIELYLNEVMGYSWDEVHDEAERLEHHISEHFEEKISNMLGSPEYDPHGAPIPSKDGGLPKSALAPLISCEPGETVRIERVSDSDPEMLRYLSEAGLVLNVKIEIISKAPFNGPLTVKTGDSEQTVWNEVANNIFVTPIENVDKEHN